MDKLKLEIKEFDIFPEDFDTNMKVLEYYQEVIFENNQSKLNDVQNHFSLFHIVGGMIDNGGIYSILIESLGEYNDGYLEMLEATGNKSDYNDFKKIVEVFETYKDSFLEQEMPEQLDEDSDDFDSKLFELIDKIESNWYDNTEIREKKFIDYIKKNKKEIITN
ncbi:DMP19 family protein [Flavobacterium hydatis]|uniref:DNA mimic protein DMP19 C-terminal domain-containing protein n=1 Tax=Flavobacterium hydatis TaxID=991 RepID=A0A086AFD3_FLAHY|nr:DUF4375 domain-containing protein [Flavobacterium hydatis]KFF15397.1 hypothetical protein IW20_13960 [Flavobacterium hydatis]OXA91345.1 hypothetical protein B0A62_16825 [Flavobacterium hydatis]